MNGSNVTFVGRLPTGGSGDVLTFTGTLTGNSMGVTVQHVAPEGNREDGTWAVGRQ